MSRFNFDFGYEPRNRRDDRGKAVRVTVLFLIVASITAAVIYALVPKNARGRAASEGGTPSGEKPAAVIAVDGTSESIAGQSAAGASGPAAGEKAPADDKSPAVVPPGGRSGDPASDKKDADSGKGAADGGAAKFDPSADELGRLTAALRASLEDGSWRKDAVVYTVTAGDTLSKLAFRHHTTVSFIQRWNDIKRADDIKIGQKICFIRAEKWRVAISRKSGTLTLFRFSGGREIPFAIFPCRVGAGRYDTELVICNRILHPSYIDGQGRRIAYNGKGNPLGEVLWTLSAADRPGSPILHWPIHGSGDAEAVEKSLKSGGIVLSNEDILLLYHLVPERTPVSIE